MKKPKKRKYVFNLKTYIISVLRRASYRSPTRSEALRLARLSRNCYRCADCGQLCERKEIKVDHKAPVVPVTGWDGWDGFIVRLFCDISGLQCLCVPCHTVKTKAENQERKKYRK